MVAREIGYVELYAGDEQSAVDYFVTSLGFSRKAECGSAGSRSSLLTRGSVRLIVTGGPATEGFLDAHGEGIADIAFVCDDISEICERAEATGTAVLRSETRAPVVTGHNIFHTLMTECGALDSLGGRSWIPVGEGREETVRPAAGISALDHVAICVDGGTLADCADFYSDIFGFGRYSSEYTEVGDQAMDSIVVRSPSGRVTFTLLAPDLTRNPGQLDAFLSRNSGPGVQHLAFLVDDIIAAVDAFRGRGIQFLQTPNTYYEMLEGRLPEMRGEIARLQEVNVLADRDEWGYMLQIFTRSPYERNTLFYELVERRGARGFGSQNIKALYEAVERDGLSSG